MQQCSLQNKNTNKRIVNQNLGFRKRTIFNKDEEETLTSSAQLYRWRRREASNMKMVRAKPKMARLVLATAPRVIPK